MAKNRFEGKTCYACEASAIGIEHAPPRSCFPKRKRQNPITVPACAKHNQNKNLEDELIKAIVVFSNNGSPDGMEVLESVIRAMEKDSSKMRAFLPSPRVVRINGREMGTFRINLARFNQSISLIVRALWFKARTEKLLAALDVQWPLLRRSNLEASSESIPLNLLANSWPASDYKGFYPEVFRYDFHEYPDSEGGVCWVCRLCFYEGTPIIVTWKVF